MKGWRGTNWAFFSSASQGRGRGRGCGHGRGGRRGCVSGAWVAVYRTFSRHTVLSSMTALHTAGL